MAGVLRGERVTQWQAEVLAAAVATGPLQYDARADKWRVGALLVQRETVRPMVAAGMLRWAGVSGRDLMTAEVTARGRTLLQAMRQRRAA